MTLQKTVLFLFISSALTSAAQKNKTVTTDSSVIDTKYFPDFGYIGEFNELKNEKKVYFRKFDYTTKKITEEGVWVNGYNVGLWKYYSANGIPERTINYENGEVTQLSGLPLPYLDRLNFIKHSADSFLVANFGKAFFTKHIQWNAGESFCYHNDLRSPWFEKAKTKPTLFLLRYDVLFSNSKYPLISFFMDTLGKPTHRFWDTDKDTKGIIKCHESDASCVFHITMEKAIALGKEEGLKLNDKKHMIYLDFVPDGKAGSIYGDYELIVADFDRSESKGYKSIHYYNALVIDPWTGKIKEKTVMSQMVFPHSSSTLKRVK